MSDIDPGIRLLAEAALPRGAEFGIENFAGDPTVKHFFEWAKVQLAIDPIMLVSWSCPPEVMLLRTTNIKAIVRSERFDTLLVEYDYLKMNAMSCAKSDVLRINDSLWLTSPESTSKAIIYNSMLGTTVLRWMCEFFLGFRLPVPAASALIASNELSFGRFPLPPFRDESLESLPEIPRAAMQCFCLAHEISHITQEGIVGNSLDTVVDGRSLRRHFERDCEELGVDERVRQQMMELLAQSLNADNLMREIDADFRAFGLVTLYLQKFLDVDLDNAIYATLYACEAQCFLYSAKYSCSLLRGDAIWAEQEDNFVVKDWLAGAQVSVRARCLLRRAGILMAAALEYPEKPKADKINECVPKIDAMFTGDMAFRARLAEVFQEKMNAIVEEMRSPPAADERFASQLKKIDSDGELRMDLFWILVAMGYPGGTDPIRFIQWMFTSQHTAAH